MIFLTNDDLYDLIKSFESRTITKDQWNHAAHLAVGLCYCLRLPFAVAKNVMRDGIYWLNDSHGTPNTDNSGYHETLTVFWLKRIWNFIDEKNTLRELAPLANELIDKLSDPKLPLRYYSWELLFSAEARRDYFPPDLHIHNHSRISTVCLP